jgi:hypothetical protein
LPGFSRNGMDGQSVKKINKSGVDIHGRLVKSKDLLREEGHHNCMAENCANECD